ncbi:MAG TPA: aldehyde dehydrogenase family protein [Polyangiaceae bacterium]|nr:aldehyde dehydrogenase family protein [Polyangiaceae bacterium]
MTHDTHSQARQAPRASVGPTPLDSVAGIVERARDAQELWASLTTYERIRAIAPVRTRALRAAEEACSLVASETGRLFEDALTAEVTFLAELVDYWVAEIEGLLEPAEVLLDPMFFPKKRGRTERVARGVIALITPWEQPLAIPMRTLVPALLAGNAVVFHPSERAPAVGALVASWFDGLLPDGVLQVVQGGRDAVRRIVDAGVDGVVFAGEEREGREVAAACAERLVPCSLELEGKDAAIVLAGARLERTVRGVVWGAFHDAGQSRSAIKRVFVERAIAEPFLRRLVEVTKELRPGLDYGSVASVAQLGELRSQVQDALNHGGELLAGGELATGSTLVAPTIVRVTNSSVGLMRDASFGPALGVEVVDSAEQAIVRANQCRFGMTASVWSRDIGKAERIARRLRAGVVTINNHGFTAVLPGAPWGAAGASGWGVSNGEMAIEQLTRPMFVLTDRSRGRREGWWYPYGPSLRRAGLALARARGGAGFFGRIAAWFRLLGWIGRRALGA